MDGRYYLQADRQVDTAYWEIMKSGLPDTKSHEEWMRDNLPSAARVGLDPNVFSPSDFDRYSKYLSGYGHTLVSLPENLVDLVWEDKPPISLSELEVQQLAFSGQRISEKIERLRSEINNMNGEALVVSTLDEIACEMAINIV